MNLSPAFDASLRKIMRNSVPGLSILIVDRDGVRWSGGFGLADIATEKPASVSTVYPWFSMTKLVTATCVLQLVENGRIGLDDSVAALYPQLEVLRPSSWAKSITVRHLLNHTSGLPNPMPIAWVHSPAQQAPEPEAFLRRILSKHGRLRSQPGSVASYSNLNSLLLGELIASTTGSPYTDYVRQHILKPLGMTHTDFVLTPEVSPLAATPYQKYWAWMTPVLRFLLPRWIFGKRAGAFVELNRFYLDGAAYGGLIGSAADAGRFLRMHLNGGEVDGRRILSAESVTRMQTVGAHGRSLDVGLGWFRRSGLDHLEHLGGGGGFFHVMRIYPHLRTGVIVMGNSTSYDSERVLRLLPRTPEHAIL